MNKTIAFLQFGAMADILYATPTLREVRRRNPDAFITWYVRDVFRNVVDTNPNLNAVKIYELPTVHDNKQLNEGIMWDKMKREGADECDEVCAPQMWPDHNFYRSQRTLMDMMAENVFGMGFELADHHIDLRITDGDRCIVDALFPDLDWSRVVTVNHISYAASPVWTFKQYFELARALHHLGLIPMFTGAKDEPIPTEHWHGPGFTLENTDARGTSYREWAECIRRSSLWLGLDSGAVTLAASTDTPIIKLHSPDFPLTKTGIRAMRMRLDDVLEIAHPPTVESMVDMITKRRRENGVPR
jgi:ADP-heptose:LPS heptosyltransferase